jgi:hypothetical protein
MRKILPSHLINHSYEKIGTEQRGLLGRNKASLAPTGNPIESGMVRPGDFPGKTELLLRVIEAVEDCLPGLARVG